MLAAAALAAAGLPGASLLAESGAGEPRKLRVVVAGGHPGDPEYGCGGTVARYTALGHEVVLLYLNRGGEGIAGKSVEGAEAIRTAEARRACEMLKARPVFAGQADGRSVVDEEHYRSFHALLAAENPDVVFTQWPIDGHPDHRATAVLTHEAWQRMNKKCALYYYEVTNGEDTQHYFPQHYVDISAVKETKRAACFAHASQAPEKFYVWQEQVARFRGLESGHEQAEAFIRHVQSPDSPFPPA
jgi:LmbE family N-acetylglucosaminyl deacetylase